MPERKNDFGPFLDSLLNRSGSFAFESGTRDGRRLIVWITLPAERGPCLDRHSPRNHSGLVEFDDCWSRTFEGLVRRWSAGWFGSCMRGRGDRSHLLAAETAVFRFQKNPGPWAW